LIVLLKLIGVVVKSLHIFVIKVDNGLVGSDTLRGDRLGKYGATAGD
jgi:hypothetical protein